MKRFLLALLFLTPSALLATDGSFTDLHTTTDSGRQGSFRTFIDPASGLYEPYVKVDGALGGGGGGAVTIADGAAVTLGAKADAAASTDTGTFSQVALQKRALQDWTSFFAIIPTARGQQNMAGSLSVAIANDQGAIPVSGTFFQTIQPISIAEGSNVTLGTKADTVETGWSNPATEISLLKGVIFQTALTATNTVNIPAKGAATTPNSMPVNIASDQTVPVSGTVTANLGTLNGAATAAKQPALGTAGTASADVITVQGAAGMTALSVTNTTFGTGTVVSSSALEASHVLKASAGTLVSIIGYNNKSSAQFIQLFNSTTVPADTTVPIATFTVPATSNFSYDVPHTGLPFATGIAISNSSTAATKTIGSADCFFTAVVK